MQGFQDNAAYIFALFIENYLKIMIL